MVTKMKSIFGGKLFLTQFDNKDTLVTFKADAGWFSSNTLDELLKTKKLQGYQIFWLYDNDLEWVKTQYIQNNFSGNDK